MRKKPTPAPSGEKPTQKPEPVAPSDDVKPTALVCDKWIMVWLPIHSFTGKRYLVRVGEGDDLRECEIQAPCIMGTLDERMNRVVSTGLGEIVDLIERGLDEEAMSRARELRQWVDNGSKKGKKSCQ